MTTPSDQVFYPSVACNLRIRLDEVYHTGAKGLPPPAVSVDDRVKATRPSPSASKASSRNILQNLNQVTAAMGALLAPEDPKKSAAQVTNPNPSPGPGFVSKSSSDPISSIIGVVPTHATIELPGYRQAGKWSCQLLFRDLPLDPRMIRAIGIEFYIGTIKADDFSRGVTNLGLKEGVPRSSIIPTLNQKGGMADKLAMVGAADEISIEMSSSGYVIDIEGRDLRGILLDAKIRPAQLAALDLSQSIRDVVQTIVRQHPLLSDFKVYCLPTDWPNGQIPSPAVIGDLTRVNVDDFSAKAQKGGTSGNKKPALRPSGTGSDISFWDIITKYCFLVGAIPYFQGEELWIRPALSIYDYTQNPNHFPHVPIPFEFGAPRPMGAGNGLIYWRRMVFGRNIEKLSFKRKLGGTKTPAVEIVCTNTSSAKRGDARLLTGRYPAEDSIPTSISPSGDSGHADVLRIPVCGISSQAQLDSIARATWEEISRGEITGSVSTKDLCSFGGNNDDADLLQLRPGDPIDIVMDVSPGGPSSIIASEPNFQAQRTPAEQVKVLTKMLGDPKLAQALVDTANGAAKLPYTFRTNTVKFSWELGKGIAVDFDFHNYVEARVKEEERIKASKTSGAVKSVTGASKTFGYGAAPAGMTQVQYLSSLADIFDTGDIVNRSIAGLPKNGGK